MRLIALSPKLAAAAVAAVLVAWRWRRSRRHAGLTLVYAVHEKICEYLRPVRHKQQ
jgi:hypothetical protein